MIHGWCERRFEAVRDALARNFGEHGEVGCAVAVTIDGCVVVDLWAGWMDRARTRPWCGDTLIDVFSVGKPMAALCLLRLVERGAVDLDAPITRYWPAFAAGGKDAITIRMLLCHQAALPGFSAPLPPRAMYDAALIAGALAREVPWWPPGRAHGYHVNTFGFLVGEIVRRVSGEGCAAFFQREIGGPLGAEFCFGVGPELDGRVADYLLPESDDGLVDFLLASESDQPVAPPEARRTLLHRVYCNPPGISGFGTVNTRAWRAADMPSVNGHATARGVARVYSALACGGSLDGVCVLGADTLAHATAEAAAGPDLVLGRTSRFGLGFQLTRPEAPFGTRPRSFGHFGAGGAVGFADPDARLAFAYVMNQPGPRWRNPRNRSLIDALYASL